MWGRLSVAKPPRAAPGLAAQAGTAVAPRHKGAPCPTGPVSARLCPKPPRPAVRARPSAASLPAPPHVLLRLLHASPSPAAASCRPLPSPTALSIPTMPLLSGAPRRSPRRHPHPSGPRRLDPSSEPRRWRPASPACARRCLQPRLQWLPHVPPRRLLLAPQRP
jgi:hypothetical protein